MSLATGTKIGNYEIVSPLGSGGMGEVYRARDVRLGRSVAIKALPPLLARDPERLARLEREARALAAVHHPNLAVLYGIEDDDGTSYLAMELVEGETLGQRLTRGALTVAETLEVGAQIASAVDAAHEQGIVHRDLKPSNVMVTTTGTVKVLDFGLAKAGSATVESALDLSASPTVAVGSTTPGLVLGTASYMSPEQARGRAVDRRTDVWALGCILFECVTGRQAFAGETSSDVLARVLERDPDWTLLPATVPARLRDALRRCLTKTSAERPRDLGDLRGELLAIAADLSSPGPRAAAAGPPSLAVLYFQNVSTEADTDYFCEGVTEDIITDLSKVKGLRVASRNAVTRYRGAQPDVGRVAADLGVQAVLEGTVRRAGSRVRLTVQLVNADGFQIWGDRYDRTLEDVFAVQEEIASAIAGALRVALTPAETERLGQDRPQDVRAYELYLKGRALYNRYTPEALREAIRLFEQAIAVDASYALAYAGVGDAYGQLVQWSDEDPEPLVRKGLEAARRAIALNPRLPEAHKAEALVLGFAGDPAGCAAALRRAIQADPRFTPALGNLSVHCFRSADLAGCERAIRRSIECDPVDPHAHSWLAFVLSYTGRLDASDAAIDRIESLSSDPFYLTIVYTMRAVHAVRRGRIQDVERFLEAGRKAGAEATNLAMIEAWLASKGGDDDRATHLLREHSESFRLNFGGVMFGVSTALRLGDTVRAVEILGRRAVADASEVLIRVEPMLSDMADLEPFAPRRSSLTLTWPIEAPMPDRALLRLFREVRLQSGTPEGDILSPDASSG